VPKTVREPIVERNQRIAKLAAERVIDRIEKFRDQLGVRPWEGAEMTPEESLAAFAEIVDDPQAWTQLIDAERQLYHLTPDRAPKRLIQEASAMYEKLQKNGRPAPLPETEEEGY